MTRLSAIIPAYNEEKVIADSVTKVATYLEKAGDAELIVVDDGSSDRTRDTIDFLESSLFPSGQSSQEPTIFQARSVSWGR